MEDDELEAMRAHFPLSFGKSSNVPPKPTEAIHSATRRTDAGVSSSDSGFPSLSSSSKSWLQSVRAPKRNPKSNPAPPPDDDVSLGPPPPPPPPSQEKEEEDDDGVMVGPPPPPPPKGSDDEDDMIGPPPPPPPHVDSDEDEDDVDDEEEENRYKIPLSNEIQLKGHTKV